MHFTLGSLDIYTLNLPVAVTTRPRVLDAKTYIHTTIFSCNARLDATF